MSNSDYRSALKILKSVLGADSPFREYYRGWIVAVLAQKHTIDDANVTADQIIDALIGESA